MAPWPSRFAQNPLSFGLAFARQEITLDKGGEVARSLALRKWRNNNYGRIAMMTSRARNLWPSRLALLGALVLVPTVVLAAGRPGKVPKPWQFNAHHDTIDASNDS